MKARLHLCGVVAGTVIVALFLRWYFVIHAQVADPYRGDAIQYYSYAWNLVHNHVFSSARPGTVALPDSFRDPGYAVMIAAWMRVTEDLDLLYAAIVMTQVVLAALTAGMTVLLARTWLPLSWASVAGFLVAVWPHCVTSVLYVLSETLFGFLAVLAVLLFAWMVKCRSPAAAVVAGLTFGCACLVNTVLLPCAFVLALSASRDCRKNVLMAFIVAALAFPAMWHLRNALVHSVSPTSLERAAINFVEGSHPEMLTAWRASAGLDTINLERVDEREPDKRISWGKATLAEIQNEEQGFLAAPKNGLSQMMSRFAADPFRYLSWYLTEKPALLWGWNIQVGQDIYTNPTRNSPLDSQPLLRAVVSVCYGLNPWIGLLAVVVAAAVVSGRARLLIIGYGGNDVGVVVLSAMVWVLALVTCIHTLLQAEPRYSIPYRPFEVMIAVTDVAWLSVWLDRLRRSRKANHATG